MKHLRLILICLLSQGNLLAQNSDMVVEYSVISDKPNFSYFGAGASYDLSVNKYNFTLAAFGLDGKFMHEYFWADFNSRYHLGENLTDAAWHDPYAYSVYEPEHSRDIKIQGGYYFYNDINKRDIFITVKQRGNVDYVIEVPTKVSHRWSVDAGFESGFTYYNLSENSVEGLSTDGTTQTLSSQNERSIATGFKYSFIRLGGGSSKVNNITINTKQFGEKSDRSLRRLYGQVFFLLNGVVDDVFMPYDWYNDVGEPYTRYDLQTNMEYRKIGGCLGWEVYNFKPFGVGGHVELGMFPGPKVAISDAVYLDFKLRFHFGKFL